jgi:hypothetical protein
MMIACPQHLDGTHPEKFPSVNQEVNLDLNQEKICLPGNISAFKMFSKGILYDCILYRNILILLSVTS